MSLVPLHQRVPILSTIPTSYRSPARMPTLPFPFLHGAFKGGGLTPDPEIPKPARAHTSQSAIKTHQALRLGIQDSLFPPDQLRSGLYHFLFRLLE